MQYQPKVGDLVLHKPTQEQGEVWNTLPDGYIQVDFGKGRPTNGRTLASNCVHIKHYKRTWAELSPELQAIAIKQMEFCGDRDASQYPHYKYQITKEGTLHGWITPGIF